jgi:hypothetical protein
MEERNEARKKNFPVCYIETKKNNNSKQVESQPRDMQHSFTQFDGYPQHKTYVSTSVMDPDPLVRVMDPYSAPDRSIIQQK